VETSPSRTNSPFLPEGPDLRSRDEGPDAVSIVDLGQRALAERTGTVDVVEAEPRLGTEEIEDVVRRGPVRIRRPLSVLEDDDRLRAANRLEAAGDNLGLSPFGVDLDERRRIPWCRSASRASTRTVMLSSSCGPGYFLGRKPLCVGSERTYVKLRSPDSVDSAAFRTSTVGNRGTSCLWKSGRGS